MTSADTRTDLHTALDRGLADDLAGLRAALAADAERSGLLDVGYDIVDTPIGALLVAATGQGVVRVAFAREDHDQVLAELAATIGPRILRAPAAVAVAAGQLDEYLRGRRHGFDLPLDLRVSGFRQQVLTALRGIGYGATRSYAEIAAVTGSPRAVRAVGTACARNPLPLLIPCHRVVRADGSPGSYLGGAEVKRALLALEAA
ncbi:methylated-DNA--[protein]-cysteine S-methyltransferase [Nakamurella flavida]|uniref:Methylated-DNA--protein-cysteine methyltransferase n=1 Tax=Nakamurella flavida TaxID=363630 RepID=A0A938YM63_9ACTN|nr:methylated-DNA--[protein]-cysteine S-methyltransferase [Nakamurella flavida]MBM9477759.1 methylated-DNA--[protein]-cysteine S-methyltransferase [Nakamurella flavida]MDP9779311.1 methylated-DNA-[protein]-cysteine S-methyltransferase [Nakamurella flavida]